MISCEIELDFSWSKKCIISEISIIRRIPGNKDPNSPIHEVPAIQTTAATFQINNAKLYVPFVTLSISDNINILENIKQGFKRTISWNKWRSEITTQRKNNNLGNLIDPTFTNINRLLVLSFRNGDNDPTRDSFEKYYIPLVEIKDFNALTDNKLFFEKAVKDKQEAYEKFTEMLRNDN